MSRQPHLLLMPPNWIGDAVMAQPAMRAIIEHSDTDKISICGRPWLKELLPYLGLDAARYEAEIPKADVAYLFPNSFRSALQVFRAGVGRRIGYAGQWRRLLLSRALPHRVSLRNEHHREFYLDIAVQLGIEIKERQVRLVAPEGEAEAGQALMHGHGLEPERTICIAPGAQFGAAKCYPPEQYAAIVQALAAAGWQPLILGMPEDRPTGDAILTGIGSPSWNAAGETRLAEALQLLAACRLLLCNDSGLMHVAAGLGKPTVVPFGATDPARTSPSGPRVRILYRPADCSPCLERECRVPGHPCMANITPAMLTEACLAMLSE